MKDAIMAAVSPREWYYQKDGTAWGPLTREELHELVEEGHVETTVLVRRRDFSDWLPLSDVVDLDGNQDPVPVLPVDGPIPVGYARPMPPPIIPPLGLKFAGFWIRFGAFLIDLLLIGLVVNGIEFLAGVLAINTRRLDDAGGFALIVALWLYFALSESSSRQGTLGKQSFGLRVTDVYGRPLSFGRATGRFFAKYLSALPVYVGFMAIGWSDRKQGFHDQIASTVVLRNRHESG